MIDLDEDKASRWNWRMTDASGISSDFFADATIDHETGFLAIGNEWWGPGLLFVA